MASAAILVRNSQYRNLAEVACCHADVIAMKESLDATEKYAASEVIEYAEADDMKSRAAINGLSDTDELFSISQVTDSSQTMSLTTAQPHSIQTAPTKKEYRPANCTPY